MVVELCNNRNSPITMITLITIIMSFMYVYMELTKTILILLIAFYYMLFSIYVVCKYTVSHNYVKIPTLLSFFSTKGNIFTVNQYNYFFTAHTYHNNEKITYLS